MNFLSNITIGQYAPGDSFVHKMDPRFKTLISGAIIIQCFLLDKWFLLSVPFIFLILVAFLTKISFNYIMKGLKAVLPFIFITFFFNCILTSGHPIFSYIFPNEFSFCLFPDLTSPVVPVYDKFMITVTHEGIEFGFFMALRLLIIVLTTSIFTLTTSPMEITDALEDLMKWGKVIKIPVHEMAMMMSIAIRFIPTLIEHLEKIVKAQLSRGAEFENKSIIKKAKSFVPVLIPLFVNAFRTADELAVAMEARCYGLTENRTKLREMKTTWRDFASCSVIIILFAVLNYFQFWVLKGI